MYPHITVISPKLDWSRSSASDPPQPHGMSRTQIISRKRYERSGSSYEASEATQSLPLLGCLSNIDGFDQLRQLAHGFLSDLLAVSPNLASNTTRTTIFWTLGGQESETLSLLRPQSCETASLSLRIVHRTEGPIITSTSTIV